MVNVVLHQGSGTFMDPQIDPKIDPVRLILEDPCRLKALQGPNWPKFFYRPLDNGKTLSIQPGSREKTFLILAPPLSPRGLMVDKV